MRLTFVQDDRLVIIDGEGYKIDAGILEVVEYLHAIQLYQDGYIEVEWTDDRGRAIGNSKGLNGLPVDFIDTLVTKHAEKKEEIRLQEEAEEIDSGE